MFGKSEKRERETSSSNKKSIFLRGDMCEWRGLWVCDFGPEAGFSSSPCTPLKPPSLQPGGSQPDVSRGPRSLFQQNTQAANDSWSHVLGAPGCLRFSLCVPIQRDLLVELSPPPLGGPASGSASPAGRRPTLMRGLSAALRLLNGWHFVCCLLPGARAFAGLRREAPQPEPHAMGPCAPSQPAARPPPRVPRAGAPGASPRGVLSRVLPLCACVLVSS